MEVAKDHRPIDTNRVGNAAQRDCHGAVGDTRGTSCTEGATRYEHSLSELRPPVGPRSDSLARDTQQLANTGKSDFGLPIDASVTDVARERSLRASVDATIASLTEKLSHRAEQEIQGISSSTSTQLAQDLAIPKSIAAPLLSEPMRALDIFYMVSAWGLAAFTLGAFFTGHYTAAFEAMMGFILCGWGLDKKAADTHVDVGATTKSPALTELMEFCNQNQITIKPHVDAQKNQIFWRFEG